VDIETTVIQTSIWSSKYKLNMKHQITSPKNVLNSSNIVEKELTRERKSLKDTCISLNSHNSIMQSDKILSVDQDLNKNAILDIYNSNEDAKLIANTKESEDYSYLAKNNTSPELFRQRNPFIKQISDLTTSPSVLSNRNCRKRGRNLMRIRQTIIDENTIVESKYFLKQDNKEHNVLEPKNKEIEVNSKNRKCMDASVHDINQEQISTTDIAQDANLMENIDDANQNDRLTNISRNTYEKSNSNDKIDSTSSLTHSTINENYISDHFLVPSSSNIEDNDTDYKNVNSLQSNLLKSSNMENDQISCKRDIFKKQSSTNLVNIDRCKSFHKSIRNINFL